MESDPLPRVFLDANVLFSGSYSQAGPPARIFTAAALGLFQPVVSRRVIQEAVRNLRLKAPRALPRLEALLFFSNFEIVAESTREEVTRQLEKGFREDAPIMAAALACGADFLCTGDRDFSGRVAAAGEHIQALTPRELLDLLGPSFPPL